jgi:hypothetical protein
LARIIGRVTMAQSGEGELVTTPTTTCKSGF